MRFELPLPVISKVGTFTACELRKPPGGVVADVSKMTKTKGAAHSMIEFMKGVFVNLEKENGDLYAEKSNFEVIARAMPLRSSEALCIKVLSMMNPDDCVQGVYVCPGCKENVKISKENGNSKKYVDLQIEHRINEPLTFALQEPIEIKGESGDVKASAHSISLFRPTMNNFITGQNRFPSTDQARQDYAMLVDAITLIDGQPKELTWLRQWGVKLFERMGYDDLKMLLEEAKTGGIERTIKVNCHACGEIFDGDIDPASFFVSGLL